ncbi:MAG TPA: glycosyltransferase [Gemmatimonadaceae bacterium]|nr:glycosyltransferase [Gemmatimonadaceae bacterium]
MAVPHVTTWFHRHGAAPAAAPDGLDALRARAAAPAEAGLTVVLCTYRRPASVRRFLASLAAQLPLPAALVVVDASPDDATERVAREGAAALPARLLYLRVEGPLRGLTRQRNFALEWVTTDAVAFFDDDVVLDAGCLAAMEAAFRAPGAPVAGVGAVVRNPEVGRGRLWRLRRALGIVDSLAPGRYVRSGFSTPWAFLPPTEAVVEGDWLPGCCMLWRTALARELGFHAGLDGYAQGEDLEFSLRARRHGRLLVAGAARVLHLHEPAGRPDAFRLGYMAIHNRYQIHRRGLPDRRWRDVAWFTYAWTLDTLLLVARLVVPRHAAATVKEMAGRMRAAYDLLLER